MSGDIEETNGLLRSAIEELSSMAEPYDVAQEALIAQTDISTAAEALIDPTERLMGLNGELSSKSSRAWLSVVHIGAAGVRALGTINEVIGDGPTTPELRRAANHLNSMLGANHELGMMESKMEEVLREALGSLIRAGQALGQFSELRTQAQTFMKTSREGQSAALKEIKKITPDL